MNLNITNIIEINDLVKCYRKTKVLDIKEFVFKRNYSYLLVGGNGAGKSTLIKLITKLVRPSYGKVLVNTRKIAYVPERFTFPDNLSIYEFLDNLCKVKGMDNPKEAINKLLKWWDLDGKKKIGSLSKGMKQKVLIIQAIIKEVDLYIFDEPLNGLDVLSQNDFLNALKHLKELGKTIIVCTHYDKYYESFFDYFIYMNGGIINEVKKCH